MMKKALKIIGLFFGLIMVLILAFFAWIYFSPMPTYETQTLPVAIPADSAALAHGQMVVQTECVICHMGPDGKLSGRRFTPPGSPFGEIWSANITKNAAKGISAYSDGELAYLFKTGITRDGRFVPFMMMPNLSDEHLGAVMAYLRSGAPLVQPSAAEPPASRYGFLAKALMRFGVFAPKFREIRPIATPDPSDKVAYGKYLATAGLSCFKCHSESFETTNEFEPEKTPGFFGGGNPVEDEEFRSVYSANLTMSREHGVGSWSEEEFVRAVQTGQGRDGKILAPQMPRYAGLTADQISAIWAYLQTVPVLEKDISAIANQ